MPIHAGRIHGPMALLAAVLLAAAPGAVAQQGPVASTVRGQVRDQAAAVLSLMAYMVVPDVTTSSLSVGNTTTGNPSIGMTQLGGGFTWSKSVPLYMEGNIAYTRFDPRFLVSDGTEQREIPTKWNGLGLTVGLGWDFSLAQDLVLRPILMGNLSRVVSDLKGGLWYINQKTDNEFQFLDGGKLKAYGAGGALMLDYERMRPERDIDVELRYTNVLLRTRSDQSPDMRVEARAESLNLWSRLRTPTGIQLMQRPLRSVLEFTHTNFLGSQTNLIGFDTLSSLGFGLELDLTAHEVFVTRARMMARYLRGDNVEGWSIGFAVSF